MFDRLSLLADGYPIYHGPASEALTFFQSIGLHVRVMYLFIARRYVSAVYAVALCLSVCVCVCLSQVGVLLKRLNELS